MKQIEQYGTALLRRTADRIAAGIITGHDWPNSDDELARLQAASLLRESADKLDRIGGTADVLVSYCPTCCAGAQVDTTMQPHDAAYKMGKRAGWDECMNEWASHMTRMAKAMKA